MERISRSHMISLLSEQRSRRLELVIKQQELTNLFSTCIDEEQSSEIQAELHAVAVEIATVDYNIQAISDIESLN